MPTAKREKNSLTKIILITISIFGIVACNNISNNSNDNQIEAGFFVTTNSGEASPWLATAIKTNETQSKKAMLDVCAGYKSGFADKASQGVFSFNPNDGLFVLRLIVRDNNGKDVLYHDDVLTSFLDENQYSFQIINCHRIFKYSTSIEMDFNRVPLQRGYIIFNIYLIDQDLEKISLNCGVDSAFLYFSKLDDYVCFSNMAFSDSKIGLSEINCA
jgi:hypothetical protein